MPDAFQILARFLDRFGGEVEGRSLEEPPEAVLLKLRDLARGRLPEAETAELMELLNRNPHWISRLADEVKALRSGPTAND